MYNFGITLSNHGFAVGVLIKGQCPPFQTELFPPWTDNGGFEFRDRVTSHPVGLSSAEGITSLHFML